jgi:hypothetical protein
MTAPQPLITAVAMTMILMFTTCRRQVLHAAVRDASRPVASALLEGLPYSDNQYSEGTRRRQRPSS